MESILKLLASGQQIIILDISISFPFITCNIPCGFGRISQLIIFKAILLDTIIDWNIIIDVVSIIGNCIF